VTISPEGKITDVKRGHGKGNRHAEERLIGTDFSDYFTEPEKAARDTGRFSHKGSSLTIPDDSA